MSISHTLIDKSVDSSENSRRAGELAVRRTRTVDPLLTMEVDVFGGGSEEARFVSPSDAGVTA
jgi:hypothetical protein